MVAYSKAPTTDLYRVGSEKDSYTDLVNLQPPTMGEEMELASSILVLVNRSLIYLD